MGDRKSGVEIDLVRIVHVLISRLRGQIVFAFLPYSHINSHKWR